jgi:hypothetical protein
MIRVTLQGLKSLCETHLVELKFIRRIRTADKFPTRRMLCTRDMRILESELGRIAFNYTTPTGSLPYDATSKNLLTVFDIIYQDWRSIPVESVAVLVAVPTNPQKQFWQYFDTRLRNMTKTQKRDFINK